MNASVRINNFIYITLLKISILTSLDMSEVDTVWTWGGPGVGTKKFWSEPGTHWNPLEPTFWVPTRYPLEPTFWVPTRNPEPTGTHNLS